MAAPVSWSWSDYTVSTEYWEVHCGRSATSVIAYDALAGPCALALVILFAHPPHWMFRSDSWFADTRFFGSGGKDSQVEKNGHIGACRSNGSRRLNCARALE